LSAALIFEFFVWRDQRCDPARQYVGSDVSVLSALLLNPVSAYPGLRAFPHQHESFIADPILFIFPGSRGLG
jgi:hypothetical protein